MEVESIVELVAAIQAQCGGGRLLIVVVGGLQRLHRPGVGVGERAGQRRWHRHGQVAAGEIRGDGDRVLRNSVGIEHPVPAQLSRIDERTAGQRSAGVCPQATIGIRNVGVRLDVVLVGGGADPARTRLEGAAIVEVELQIDILRSRAATLDLREGFSVAGPLLVYRIRKDVRPRPVGVLRRSVVLTQRSGAGVPRIERHVRGTLPVGGIELYAEGTVPLVLVGVEIVAGHRQAVAQIRLERCIDGLALALGLQVVQGDILTPHEYTVGLAVTIDVHAAIRVLHDLGRNRCPVPGSQETVVGSRAVAVFAVEDDAVLVETGPGVFARCVGVVPGDLQAPATVGVVGDQAGSLWAGLLRRTAAFGIGLVAIGKPARQVPGPEGVQVERAGDASFGEVGGAGLDDVDLVEQRRRYRGEVRLLRVDLVGRHEHFAVQHRADLRQAPDVHLCSHAGVAVDLHARDALQRIGEGDIGQGADALCRDAVLDVGCQALQFDRAYLRLTHTGDSHELQFRCGGLIVLLHDGGVGLGIRRWRCRGVLLRSRHPLGFCRTGCR